MLIESEMPPLTFGMPKIIIVDATKPKRPHRQKRIQKKWAKRYGYIYAIKDDVLYKTKDAWFCNPRMYYKVQEIFRKELTINNFGV